MRGFLLLPCSMLFLLCAPSQSEAGILKLLAQGANRVARKVGLVGRESAEAGLRSAVKRTATAAPTVIRKSAGQAARSGAASAARAGAKNAMTTISRNLGPAGVAAAAKLSRPAARKLADVSSLIIKSPHKAKWIKLLDKHGDACADYLWKYRRSIAVGSVATGFVLHPNAFTKMIGEGVDSVGEHVVSPAIRGVTGDMVKPLIESAVGTPGRAGLSIWGWSLFNGVLIGSFVWWRLRRK